MVYLLTIQTQGKQILLCTAAIRYSTAQHTVGRGLKKDIIIIKIYIYIHTNKHKYTTSYTDRQERFDVSKLTYESNEVSAKAEPRMNSCNVSSH